MIKLLKRHLPLLFALLAAISPFHGLTGRDLWNPDEADHATAAREMLVNRDWIVPTIGGETFAEKPPLQLWVAAGSAALRGSDVDLFDARLPSVLGHMLAILGAYYFGRRSGGVRTGAVAAAVTWMIGEVIWRSRWCQVDMLFSGFWIWAAIWLFELRKRVTLWNVAGSGVALSLAILSKGPIAPALLVAAAAGDALLNPFHRTEWFRWRTAGACAAAMGLAVVCALPWYVCLALRDSDGLGRSLVHENASRFLHSQDHARPIYYYLSGALWSSFAPASLFIPPAVIFAFRSTRSDDAVYVRDRGPVAASLGALAGGLLLLSLASSKQGKYLLPLAPFLGIVIADFARNVDRFGARWQRIWITAVLSVVGLVLVICALFTTAASWFGPRSDDAFASMVRSAAGLFGASVTRDTIPPVSVVLLPLLLAGFGSFALLAVGMHTRASFRLMWLLVPLGFAMVQLCGNLLPGLDAVKSPKPVVDAAMERLAALEAGGSAGRYAVYFPPRTATKSVESWTGSSQFVYYARESYRKPLVLRGFEDLSKAVSDSRPLVFVTRADYYKRLPPDLQARLSVFFQKQVGERTLCAIESR